MEQPGMDSVSGPGGWENLDFAAKVRWRMLHERNPLHPVLLDKVRVKEFARMRGVESSRTFHVSADPDDIPFDELPGRCFLKANHASSWNFLRHDGEWYYFGYGARLLGEDGSLIPEPGRSRFRIARQMMRELCRRMLGAKYSRSELGYHVIPPRILIEEVMDPPPGETEIFDYRFYTFGGEVRAISLGSPSFRRLKTNVFLTPEWEVIPLTSHKEALPEVIPPSPANLRLLLEAARGLGLGIDFARVDLYRTMHGIRLGEMTMYPEAGDTDTPTSCPRFNRWLGSFWKSPADCLS